MPSFLRGLIPAVLTSLLLWFGSGLHAHWWLTWLVALPMLVVAPDLSGRATFGWSALGWLAGSLNLWTYAVQTLEAPVPVVLGLLVVESLLFAVVVTGFRSCMVGGRPVLAILLTSAVGVVLDAVLSRLSPHGTFTSLSWTQAGTPLLPMVAVTGAAGIAAMLYAVPATLAVLIRTRSRATMLAAGGVVALLVVLPLAGHAAAGEGDAVRVAMVNTPAGPDDGPATWATPAGEQVLAADRAGIRAARARGAKVAVLAESGLLVPRDQVDDLVTALTSAAADRIDVVVGVVVHEPTDVFHNEAVLLRPGRPAIEYRKQHPIPGVEEVEPGQSNVTAEVAGVRAALLICKDLDFPWTVRAASEPGVGLLLAPAWDFGADGWLHSQMATVRAAENGASLVRTARDGRDVATDAHGRVIASSDTVHRPTQVLVTDVVAGDRTTPYTRFGEWFVLLCAAVVAGCLVAIARRRR